MAVKKVKEYRKAKVLRLSDATWKQFAYYKPRDKTWELFIQELTDIVKYFQKLSN